MENSRPQSCRGSMLDMSLQGLSKGDPTRNTSRLSRLPDAGPPRDCEPPRSLHTWMYDQPAHVPQATKDSRPKSSLDHKLEERPSSGLSRDALLNRQQRYEFWAEQIRRETEAIERVSEDLALKKSIAGLKMTKAEKRQSVNILEEAERALKEGQVKGELENSMYDPETAAMARRQQQEIYEQRAKCFAEVVARMDANCPMLKEEKFREYLYLLCDSDDLVLHERKQVEKTKREILTKWYAFQDLLCDIYQNAGEDDFDEFEMPTARHRGKPLGVSVKEISANLQIGSDSEEGEQ